MDRSDRVEIFYTVWCLEIHCQRCSLENKNKTLSGRPFSIKHSEYVQHWSESVKLTRRPGTSQTNR